MYAVEFLADIQEGKIKIPEAYLGRLHQKVKVILLSSEPESDNRQSIMEVLDKAPGQRVFKSANEVDAFLKSERDSWQ